VQEIAAGVYYRGAATMVEMAAKLVTQRVRFERGQKTSFMEQLYPRFQGILIVRRCGLNAVRSTRTSPIGTTTQTSHE
jgi:hypothetical protein